jgi:hypothetical protein
METTKHLAFLLDYPAPGKFMMFPDYYENMQDDIDSNYIPVEFKITDIRWDANLSRTPYKVFKLKETKKPNKK